MSFDKILKRKQQNLRVNYFKYIKIIDSKKIYNSPFRYPCTWYENLSKSFLNYLNQKNKKTFIKLILSYFKEVLLIITLLNYNLYSPKLTKNKYKNVFLTWTKNSDIKKGILANDRYINQKTNIKEDIFFSINLENNFLPTSLKNIHVLSKVNSSKHYMINLFLLFKFIFFSIIKNNFFHSLNVYSFFSYMFYLNFKKIFSGKKFENLYMSYEGQPFQNYLIQKIREEFKDVKIYGIVKSFQPNPLHLYKHTNAPDKIIYSHKSIKMHMIKNLKWKKNDFEEKTFYKLNNFKGKILLPFSIKDYNKIFVILEKLFKNNKIKELNSLKLKLHPNTPEYEKQIIFKKKIAKFIKNKKYKKKNNVLIAIGATSVIMENLLLGNVVYQIFENETLECLSTSFWPKLKSKRIDTNVVRYSLS